MSGRLEGKIAIVTGASSGIGAVSAVTLAREGAKVALVARRPAEGGEVAEAATRAGEANGGEGRFVQADVTDPQAITEMVETVRGWWGPSLHVLFNNAGGIVGGGRFPRERLENFEATLRLSLTSVWLVTKACWEALSGAGGSSIITSSTIGAAMVLPSGPLANSKGYPHSGYNAAKAGVEALTGTLLRRAHRDGSGPIASGPVRSRRPLRQRLTANTSFTSSSRLCKSSTARVRRPISRTWCCSWPATSRASSPPKC